MQILNLEYSRVTKGYEHLEHHMSLLVTREIMLARATLHLSGTVSSFSVCVRFNSVFKCYITVFIV